MTIKAILAEIQSRKEMHEDQLLVHDEGDPDYFRFEGAAMALDALLVFLARGGVE